VNMNKEKPNPRKAEVQAKVAKIDDAKNLQELKDALKEVLGLI